ncbi:MAG: YafY family protein [Anaerolineae bacterium]|nr:YafY family protein [Anaerolineae bacterium]
MSNVATRLISMILMLQSRHTIKASDLAVELKVSERTVHRYIAMLEEMGIPIYSERGPYGGFSLMRGYKLPPLIFTDEEATVLYMGANLVDEVWGAIYKDAVTSVVAKLDNVLPDDLRQEVSRAQDSMIFSGLRAKDYRPWEPIISTLRRCISDRQSAELTYRGFNLQETCREVDPYALIFRRGLWYLIAYCHLRDEMRTFRVDRIKKADAVNRRFAIPEAFSAREYLEHTMQFEDNFHIKIHMDNEIAPYIRENHGHWAQLDDHPDGSVTVSFGTSGLEWVTGWVLSYGTHALVLEPPELIQRVRDVTRGIASRYQD